MKNYIVMNITDGCYPTFTSVQAESSDEALAEGERSNADATCVLSEDEAHNMVQDIKDCM